jgi:methylmalonyl-CoA mutase C-terminal domain/subunit
VLQPGGPAGYAGAAILRGSDRANGVASACRERLSRAPARRERLPGSTAGRERKVAAGGVRADARIRVLVAKPGLDGHDRGARVVASALRDAGMEVIYAGLQQTPQMIVQAAIQEDVDVVALSLLSGAHMTLFPRVLELLRERGAEDVLLTGGGIIPREDLEELQRLGCGRLFGPGSSLQEAVDYIREEVRKRRARRGA